MKTTKMKTLKLLILGIVLILAGSAQGQLSVNVHIGTAPSWGPSGYDDVRYYYLPDVEAYYDIHSSMFIYISGNRWVRSSYLPRHYRNYDLNRGYKVVMHDYRGNTPYTHYYQHKKTYSKGYRSHDNRNYGEWNERTYNRQPSHKVVQQSSRQNNSYHKQPVRKMEQRHDNGNSKGNSRGNSHGNDKHDNGGNNKGKH